MNKTFLIGNLTRDPELTQTPNGVSVCKMSIAVNRNFTNANGERYRLLQRSCMARACR